MRKLKTLSRGRVIDLLMTATFGTVRVVLAVWTLSDGGTKSVSIGDILRVEELTGLTQTPLRQALRAAVADGWLEDVGGNNYVLGRLFVSRTVKDKPKRSPNLYLIKGGL
jgi:hypothetical protein